MSRPGRDTIPSMAEALRRVPPASLNKLILGLRIVGDGRAEAGEPEQAEFFYAVMIAAGEEADRRVMVEREIAAELDDMGSATWGTDDGSGPDVGGIVAPDPDPGDTG